MFLRKKEDLNIDQFWRDYETKTGEKVLAKSLGRYLGGLDEQPQPLWGLAIATTGGFRFHHFPHEGWIMALSRITSGGEAPKEKTFFIPGENISSLELIVEKRWWKKLLSPSSPVLRIRCRAESSGKNPGEEKAETEVLVETDREAGAIVAALKKENAP
ncbi:MAG: hypothetical protein LBD09_00925 [Treponema sp.]|jgi:hypothetical protein|nr:hypothetical protein [Treponema sp.]